MDGAKKCVSLSAQFFSCVFLGKNNQNSSPTLRPSLRDPGCVTDEYDTVIQSAIDSSLFYHLSLKKPTTNQNTFIKIGENAMSSYRPNFIFIKYYLNLIFDFI